MGEACQEVVWLVGSSSRGKAFEEAFGPSPGSTGIPCRDGAGVCEPFVPLGCERPLVPLGGEKPLVPSGVVPSGARAGAAVWPPAAGAGAGVDPLRGISGIGFSDGAGATAGAGVAEGAGANAGG